MALHRLQPRQPLRLLVMGGRTCKAMHSPRNSDRHGLLDELLDGLNAKLAYLACVRTRRLRLHAICVGCSDSDQEPDG